jgi:hypothetical protein
MFPSFVTHYYHHRPFQTLTRLGPDELSKVLDLLSVRGRLPQRLRSDFYFEQRRRYESLMYDQFVAKGGQPKSRAPVYAVLGEAASWSRICPRSVRIPLTAIPPDHISFTYTDSWGTYVDRDLAGNPIPRKPMDGMLYRMEELDELFRAYGWPGDLSKTPDELGYDPYVEAQIWIEPDDANLIKTWREFLDELSAEILPIYRHHERSFDVPLVHGRMHICRSLLFGEFMTRYYWRNSLLRPAASDIRYAIAFHDSGRQANGPDLWEDDSARICVSYLAKNPDRVFRRPAEVGELIAGKAHPNTGIDGRIVHDADVLDIMRPCCGHRGKAGFRKEKLYFATGDDGSWPEATDIRNSLIDEAWEFIQASEMVKERFRDSADYMQDVLSVLDGIRGKCPLLAAELLETSELPTLIR